MASSCAGAVAQRGGQRSDGPAGRHCSTDGTHPMQERDDGGTVHTTPYPTNPPTPAQPASALYTMQELEAQDAASSSPVLLEAAAAAATFAVPAGTALPLSCTCQPRTCDCDKTCYCHIRPSSYAGDRIAAPAPAGGGLPPHTPLHDCACNVGTVGGYSFDAGNTVDCDCVQAQCRCSQTCTCPEAPA